MRCLQGRLLRERAHPHVKDAGVSEAGRAAGVSRLKERSERTIFFAGESNLLA
jgi:hypothetical protein